MMDDTPTANAETMAWISTEVSPAQELASIEIEQPLALEEPAFEPDVEEPAPNGDAGPDAFELAMQAARSGRASEGIEILVREAVQERSGRARFRRKLQIAQICMATGNEAVACPILEELTREIDEHHLENWEAAEVVTQPLVLLLRCLVKVKDDPQERARIYARICRLDPVQALGCSR
jgi:type VI secretion system protein ImpA